MELYSWNIASSKLPWGYDQSHYAVHYHFLVESFIEWQANWGNHSIQGYPVGDPLSPYIFILCLERLSQLIEIVVEGGQWLLFLLFMDDMLLFLEATCLQIFCDHSGQKLSVQKNRILFLSNVSNRLGRDLSKRSGFTQTTNLEKYLGVPFLHQRITRDTYSYILDKIQSKLLGWKVNQSSLQAVLLYISRCWQPSLFTPCKKPIFSIPYMMTLRKYITALFGGSRKIIESVTLWIGSKSVGHWF